jgi:hypothetical protein
MFDSVVRKRGLAKCPDGGMEAVDKVCRVIEDIKMKHNDPLAKSRLLNAIRKT